MKDVIPGGPGVSFAQLGWHGASAVGAVRRLPPMPLQPANTNGALHRAVQAPARALGRGRGGAYAGAGKRVLDVLLVLLSLPLVLPLIAVCAAALWAESGRPFYTQARVGRGGGLFRILKLRTMVRDADQLLQKYLREDPALREEWDRTQKLKNDPRITPVGRVLRATSLDELPQLWNVLKGDMSLVGPRPMMPQQLPLYGNPHAYFALRPGITGIWQVSVRNESGFASRVEADREYLHSLAFGRDLQLIWRTLGVVAKGTGY